MKTVNSIIKGLLTDIEFIEGYDNNREVGAGRYDLDRGRGHSVIFDLNLDFDHLWLRLSETALTFVLREFIDNSLAAYDKNRERGRVTIRAYDASGYRIEVEDLAGGIPEEADRFMNEDKTYIFSGKRASSRSAGGRGYKQSKKILGEKAAGELSRESIEKDDKKGTRISISIPKNRPIEHIIGSVFADAKTTEGELFYFTREGTGYARYDRDNKVKYPVEFDIDISTTLFDFTEERVISTVRQLFDTAITEYVTTGKEGGLRLSVYNVDARELILKLANDVGMPETMSQVNVHSLEVLKKLGVTGTTLRGLQETIRKSNGELSIHTNPGKETKYIVKLT